ncbi:MAG: hypothetical protein LBO64_08680 [Desulfovibrio sp.]|nr:hypothetical protein [Desulfovibrio sp.]
MRAHVGGTWNNGSGAGLFCLNMNDPASNAAARIARTAPAGAVVSVRQVGAKA